MRTPHLLAGLVLLGVSTVAVAALAEPAPAKAQAKSGAENKPAAEQAPSGKKKKAAKGEKQKKQTAKSETEAKGKEKGSQSSPEQKGATSGKAPAAGASAAASKKAAGTSAEASKKAAAPPPAAHKAAEAPASAASSKKAKGPEASGAPPPSKGSEAGAQFGVAATAGEAASPQSDQNAAGKSEENRPLVDTLGVELEGGTNARLDGASSAFTSSESVGLTYGLGVWYSPTRLWSLGLSYQRTGLGGDSTAPTGTSVSAERSLDSVWLGGRAYPWRTNSLGVYLALELGATWQHVNASGAVQSNPDVAPAQPFACSATQGPGIALGAGGGLDVDLDQHLAFLVQADVAAHRLTSDTIGGCTQGSGSVSNLAARIGFMYRFGLQPHHSETASATPTLVRF